jgi:hypothetical protein
MASNLLETHQNKWFAPFLPRGPQSFMFTKSVLKLSVLGVSTAPSYRETYRKRWGAKPPTFSIGFLVGGIRTPKADVFRTDSNKKIINQGPLGEFDCGIARGRGRI